MPWAGCYKEVAKLFTSLKTIAKKFYCDKNEQEVLMELVRYSQDDIKEALDGTTAEQAQLHQSGQHASS